MSAIYHEDIPIVSATGLASNSTGDKATLSVPFQCQVVRAFVIWEGTSANATAAIIKFDKRVTAGSDTGRGDGDVAVIKKVASVNKQGKMTYKDVTGVTLAPGDEVVVEVTTADGAANAFTAGLIVRHVPEVAANLTDMEATT